MHYRIITLTLIIFAFFSSKQSISQELSELDVTFKKDFKKVQQYPGNDKRISNLAASYEAIVKGEEKMIADLRATGQPDIWYNIYRLYYKMELRQKEMLALPEATLKKMQFQYRDNGDQLIENKNKAEAYFYAHAKKMLAEGTPQASRQAYKDLILLAGLTNEYKDVDVMIRQAILLGATKLEYELYNKTGKEINNIIVQQLSVAVYAYRDTRLKMIKDVPVENTMPIVIRVYLNELKVSPDRTKKFNYAEERDIYQDGVVVDTIRCDVDQYKQVKGAMLSGRIDIYDGSLKSVVNTIPITAESMFMHSYATMKGNPDAAGQDTRELLAQKEVKFPSNQSIVMDAVEEFTNQAITILLPSKDKEVNP